MSGEHKRVKLIIKVVAGLIPDEPLPEYTRGWHLSREECDDGDTWLAAIGAAHMYALSLQDPTALNWVRLDWIYT